jgi:hypothetical protein
LLIGALLVLLAVTVVLPGWVNTPLEGLEPTPAVGLSYCPQLEESPRCRVTIDEPTWWPIASTVWIEIEWIPCRGGDYTPIGHRLKRSRTLTGWGAAEEGEPYSRVAIECG